MSYAVKFKGIDGNDDKRFETLKAAAAYVKDRYLGSDYIRGQTALQDEFGYYVFVGFTWSDLGKFDYREDYPEFRWYEKFGGDLDPDLDPSAPGDYRICEYHPRFGGYDEYIGCTYTPVTQATTAAEARAKLDKLEAKLGDCFDMDFDPYQVFYRQPPHGRKLFLPGADEVVALSDLHDRLTGEVVVTVVALHDGLPF